MQGVTAWLHNSLIVLHDAKLTPDVEQHSNGREFLIYGGKPADIMGSSKVQLTVSKFQAISMLLIGAVREE